MITNIILGVLLGISIYKIGELIIGFIFKNRFDGDRLDAALLDKKKTS